MASLRTASWRSCPLTREETSTSDAAAAAAAGVFGRLGDERIWQSRAQPTGRARTHLRAVYASCTSRCQSSLASAALKADFHNIAWSGAGVVWNAPGCSAEVPFKDLYLRVLGTKEEPIIKKGDGWSPEATVVYLGGNDWWSLSSRGDDALIDGLREFLTRLRAYRGPEVPICILLPSPTSVCACIGSLPDQATFAADMSRCWRAAAQLVGDEKVFLDLIEPDPPCSLSNPSDWGQMGHWSVEGNKKWAAAVVPVLKARLGSMTT
eukprot:s2716_g6.t2